MKTYLIVLALLIIILVSCKKEPETPQKPNDPTHTDTIPTPLQFQYGQLGLSDSFRNHFRCKPEWKIQQRIIGKWILYKIVGMGTGYPDSTFKNVTITSDSFFIYQNSVLTFKDKYEYELPENENCINSVSLIFSNEKRFQINMSACDTFLNPDYDCFHCEFQFYRRARW